MLINFLPPKYHKRSEQKGRCFYPSCLFVAHFLNEDPAEPEG